MAVYAIAFLFSLLFYLLLTAGSGSALLFWSVEEAALGVIFSLLAAVLARPMFSYFGMKPSAGTLNPRRWAFFAAYLFGPFLRDLVKANIDVAKRVITGNIRPGIVKISPGIKTDFGLSMLADSITLTPGTLSVDADDQRNLYVHWIYVKSNDPTAEDICGSFPKWVRRITE